MLIMHQHTPGDLGQFETVRMLLKTDTAERCSYSHPPIHTNTHTCMHINSQDMLFNCSTHLCTDIIMYGRTVDYVH